jgi:hypothetical protein
MVKQSKWVALAAITVIMAVIAASALQAARLQQGGTLMHVESVDLHVHFRGMKNPQPYGHATVRVVDQVGNGVPGAKVAGTFNICGQILKGSETTDSDGFADVPSRHWMTGCCKTFTVDSVIKSGAGWNGVEVSDSYGCN